LTIKGQKDASGTGCFLGEPDLGNDYKLGSLIELVKLSHYTKTGRGKMKARKRVLRHVINVALVLVLGFTSSNVLAGDSTGVTADKIRIGLFFALTGQASIWGVPVADPLIASIRQINREGGINGRKIDVFLEDDGGNPEKAKAAVKKLIYQDKVFALIGTGSSLPCYAAKMEIEQARVPWLAGPAIMDKIYAPTFPTTFGYGLTSSIDAQSMVDFALSKPGVKNLAFVYHYDDWGKGLLDTALNRLKEKTQGGTKVQYITEVVDKGVTDATPVVLKVKRFKPDAVMVMLFPSEGAVFIRDAHKYGLNVPIICNTASNDLKDQLRRVGNLDAMKLVFACTYVVGSIFDPRFDYLVKPFLKEFPKDKPQAMNFVGFAAAKILAYALKNAGRDLTRESFVSALEGMKNFDTEVLTSTITYSKDDHMGLERCGIVTLKRDGSEYYMPKPVWDPEILKKKGWE
jgi:branched-chain amino acid transport system substrate-binding protein